MNKIENINPKYSKQEIKNFKNEFIFTEAFVELLKQTITLLYLIVDEKYCDENGDPKKITKNEAIIGGNLTRIIKLNTSLLQNICDRKLEICYILHRCLLETSINIQYMLLEGEDNVLRNYIKYSLITEKGLWNTIKDNIKERGGDILDIEVRMNKSIEKSFDSSDFDLNDINRSSKWKSLSKRSDIVGGEMLYNVLYGISSHSIHGNWQDILFNNLEKVEGGFKLNLEWNEPKPQIMETSILFNLIIVKLFVEKEFTEKKELFLHKVKLLLNYFENLRNEHEKFIGK